MNSNRKNTGQEENNKRKKKTIGQAEVQTE
jgi:hypothetical protein